MLKNILKLEGVKKLIKKELKSNVGGGSYGCGAWSKTVNGVDCGTRTCTFSSSGTYGDGVYTEKQVCPMETGLVDPTGPE